MITIIAPAKGFIDIPLLEGNSSTEVIFKNETKELLDILKIFSSEDLSKLMKTSKDITDLNYQRFKNFYDTTTREHNSILYFNGEAYKGIDSSSLTSDDINFSQENLRILSGLYGILRPLDKIKEYRLEMGTKLSNNLGKDLYSFWRSKLTNFIIEELRHTSGDKILLNLASEEYSKSLDLKSINKDFKVVTISFKENKNGTFKVVGTYSKKARGQFVRFIIQNRIEILEETKKFNVDGYLFNKELSDESNIIFTR